MIVFDGNLTGSAEKFFINKLLNKFSLLLIVLFLSSIPIWAFLSLKVGAFLEVMFTLVLVTIFSPFFFRICVSKKERQRNLPKKVIINEGIITSVSVKTTISKNITQVKAVRDYGKFYHIVFPEIYIDAVFVCQKNLLSKGTIEEFEFLFKDKLTRRGKTIRGRFYD